MPAKKPMAAGPIRSPLIVMDGISSDHTLAATITPLAKPNMDFCSRSGISLRIRNTHAEPSTVPAKGINIPIITAFIIVMFSDAKILMPVLSDNPYF